MDANGLFPWLAEPWQTLAAHVASERVPQALLVHGPAGIGKMRLAELFANRLLCASPNDFGCGSCHGCRLFAAETHPDFVKVKPAEPGKSIGVDAVRGLISQLALKPQYGGYRIIVLAPAHQMNINAANALLKTLEEPAERTVLLLLTDTPSALPATILSRCQRLPVPLPDHDIAARWLENQGVAGASDILLATARGAPLRALALAGSDAVERRRTTFAECLGLLDGREAPMAVAGRWEPLPHEDHVEWMLTWTCDLIRLISAPRSRPLYNPDLANDLRALAGRLHLPRLCGMWSLLLKAKRALAGQINRRLLLEELLIHWSQVGAEPNRSRNP